MAAFNMTDQNFQHSPSRLQPARSAMVNSDNIWQIHCIALSDMRMLKALSSRLVLLVGFFVPGIVAIKNVTYSKLSPSEINMTTSSCFRKAYPIKYGWATCAAWCQTLNCQIFGVEGHECSICSPCFNSPPSQLLYSDMYGKFCGINVCLV